MTYSIILLIPFYAIITLSLLLWQSVNVLHTNTNKNVNNDVASSYSRCNNTCYFEHTLNKDKTIRTSSLPLFVCGILLQG